MIYGLRVTHLHKFNLFSLRKYHLKRCPVIIVDRRTHDDPSRIPGWRYAGSNHRIEDGQATRDAGIEQIPTIVLADDEIIQFAKEVGPIIIERGTNRLWPDVREPVWTIEIYNGLRE